MPRRIPTEIENMYIDASCVLGAVKTVMRDFLSQEKRHESETYDELNDRVNPAYGCIKTLDYLENDLHKRIYGE